MVPNNLVKGLAISSGVAGVIGGGTAIYLTSDSKEVKNEKDTSYTNSNKGIEQDQERNLQPVEPATKETVASLLSKKSKSIIASGETSKGSAKGTTFKEDHAQTAPTGAGIIEEGDAKKDTDEGLNTFKKLCSDSTTKEVANDKEKLFEDIMKYCVE